MALVTPNFTPATSLVFGARDFSKDMRQNQAEDTKGLQNAFKFGTQVYDYLHSREQANEMNELGTSQADNLYLEMDDMNRLAELKRELAALKGGA